MWEYLGGVILVLLAKALFRLDPGRWWRPVFLPKRRHELRKMAASEGWQLLRYLPAEVMTRFCQKKATTHARAASVALQIQLPDVRVYIGEVEQGTPISGQRTRTYTVCMAIPVHSLHPSAEIRAFRFLTDPTPDLKLDGVDAQVYDDLVIVSRQGPLQPTMVNTYLEVALAAVELSRFQSITPLPGHAKSE